jgi:hypothetical protein
MQILTGAGRLETYVYEVGDFVRLRRDEDGPIVTARAGDWGRVTRVHANGAVDIRLAGYSRAKDATLSRAVAVSQALLQPCDSSGVGRPRGLVVVWGGRRPD